MDYDENELLELAYEIMAATDEEAEIITDSLSDRQLNIVLSLIEQIDKGWI